MPSRILPPVSWLRTFEEDQPGNAKMQLEIRASDNTKRTAFFPLSLQRETRELVRRLTDHRADLPTDSAKAIAMVEQAIALGPSNTTVGLRTSKSGWYPHDGRPPTEYVMPHQTICEGTPTAIHCKGVALSWPAAAGTLPAWRDGLRPACKRSALAVFAVAAAFTGPALGMFQSRTGLLFNFAGESGTGKTTLLRMAMSVFERVETPDMEDLNISITGLEEAALGHNDMLLCLDEFGSALVDPKVASSLVTALAYQTREGRAKRRSSFGQQSLGFAHASWKTTVLTSSEETLDSLMGNQKRRVGAQIRYIDLLVPVPERGGAFAFGPKRKGLTPLKLVTHTEKMIALNYGVAGPVFIRGILADSKAEQKLRTWVSEFMTHLTGLGGEQQSRYLEAFAKVYAAGRLAIEYGVVPFKSKRLKSAISQVYEQSFLIQAASADSHRAAVQALVALGNDSSRCAWNKRGEGVESTGNFLAVRRFEKTREFLFVPRANLTGIVAPSRVSDFIEFLKVNGALITRKNAATSQMQIKGLVPSDPRPSGYKIDWQILLRLQTPRIVGGASI